MARMGGGSIGAACLQKISASRSNACAASEAANIHGLLRAAEPGFRNPCASPGSKSTPPSAVAPSNPLCGHSRAACHALTTSLDARLHIAEPLTIDGALLANFRALPAEMPVMWGTDKHEMRGRAAEFGASRHQGEMGLRDMSAPDFKAMVKRHFGTDAIAGEAVIDAGLHFRTGVAHRNLLRER